MTELNIKKARSILGKLAENLSDEQIESDIKTAEVLKNLFFSDYLKSKKSQNSYNGINNGQT